MIVVEPIHPCSNPRFDVSVVYLRLIILSVVDDVLVIHFLTDFMNLKIKLIQSFRVAYRCRVCVRIFIGVSTHTCMSIYVCTV
jgi:hypothetical protein